MTDLNFFPEDFASTVKREKQGTDSSVSLDDAVLPPSPDMLDVDQLLDFLPDATPGITSTDKTISVNVDENDDLLVPPAKANPVGVTLETNGVSFDLDLVDEAASAPVSLNAPEPAANVLAIEALTQSEPEQQSINIDAPVSLDSYEQDDRAGSAAAHISLEGLSPVQGDPDLTALIESGMAGAALGHAYANDYAADDQVAESPKKGKGKKSAKAKVQAAPKKAKVEGEQSFIEKHKPKLLIGAVVAVILGWNQYKQHNAAIVEAPVDQRLPYDQAIEKLQNGTDNVSHLSSQEEPNFDIGTMAPPVGEPNSPQTSTSAPDVSNTATETPATLPVVAPIVTASGSPEVIASAAPVIPSAAQANTPSLTPDVLPVQSAESIQAQPSTVQPNVVDPQIAQLKAEVEELKQQLKAASESKAEKPAHSVKAPVEPKPAPVASQQKDEPAPVRQAPVVSTRHASKQGAPSRDVVAAKPKVEIQYLGSFATENGAMHAHVIVAGTVFELSQGQSVAGLKVDAINANGVRIGGNEYH